MKRDVNSLSAKSVNYYQYKLVKIKEISSEC